MPIRQTKCGHNKLYLGILLWGRQGWFLKAVEGKLGLTQFFMAVGLQGSKLFSFLTVAPEMFGVQFA